MGQPISERVWTRLACPHCGGTLERREAGAVCTACGEVYPRTAEGQLDLRLRRQKTVTRAFRLDTPSLPPKGFDFQPLPPNPAPEVDFAGMALPRHLDEPIPSWFPRAKGEGSLALDLGCGKALHRAACEHAGFEYVGLDLAAPQAPLLGDAHALPFRDGTFAFVLSVAVLEHVRHPCVMMDEVCRVLQPGGTLLGTVSFLEPYHSHSLYHHTHLGAYHTLAEAGLEVVRLGPNPRRPVLVAQATMLLFPKMPRRMARGLVLPLQALHRLWWAYRRVVRRKRGYEESARVLHGTAAFLFLARKPHPDS